MALMNTGLTGHLNPDNIPLPKIDQKPQILGCFSVNTDRVYEASAENFRYFRMPEKFPLDLNEGYGQAISRNEDLMQDERLRHVLKFIYHHKEELLSNAISSEARAVKDFDFICFRGLLKVIMCTPYELRRDWCVHATRYKGNIYLSEKETDQNRYERVNLEDYQKKFLSYGYKLQQYCLTTQPTEEPITNVPVNECSEFYCVHKRQLQGMNLLYGAQVEGAYSKTVFHDVESKSTLNNIKFVKIKCCLKPGNKRQEQNFLRFKCKDWWSQCFLAGVEHLMVGYRNEEGLVDEVKHVDVSSLPKMGKKYWNPSQCLDFLAKFLQMVKHEMRNVDCPHTVYEFHFDPRSRAITYRVHGGKSSNTILPDWYIAMLQ